MTCVYSLYSTPCSRNYLTIKKERYTIWMKSLLFHGNGCTIFDSDGKIVYRIDNYEEKKSNKVYLVDLQGRILFSTRKVGILGRWNGYNWRATEMNNETPWLRVGRNCNLLLCRGINYNIVLGCGKSKQSCYKIVELDGITSFSIADSKHQKVAEVRPKQSFSGILLGDDVLSLVVEPQIDHSFIMALVAVYVAYEFIRHEI